VDTGKRFNALSHVTGVKTIDMKWHGPTSKVHQVMEYQQANMEIEVIHSLAGPLADAHHNHRALFLIYFTTGRSDYEQANQLLDEFTRTREERTEYFDRLEKKTKIILRDPNVWKAVEAVATALQKIHILEWEEVVEIISPITGEDRRPYDCMWPEHLKEERMTKKRIA
jgi:hypothetical protein